MANRALLNGIIRDSEGRPVPGASLYIYEEGTETPVAATMYEDDDPGLDTLSNPLTSGSDGRFVLYMTSEQRVTVHPVKTGYTFEDVVADVLNVNPADLAYGTAADIADVATSESAGVSTSVARADHVHAHPVIASGNLHPEYHSNDQPAPFMGCSVYKSANQTIADATTTILTFDSENYDTDGWHDTVTDNSHITPTVEGYYQVTGHVVWEDGTGGTFRLAELYKNGSGTGVAFVIGPLAVTPTVPLTFVPVYMNGTSDYLELAVRQDTGGNEDVQGSSTRTRFSVHFVGSA